MPDDLPAIATIEQDETAEQYGQVATYYPW